MGNPIQITVELDLDKYLSTHHGYDRDGEPITEPATIESLLLEQAARIIAQRVDRDEARELTRRAQAVLDEVLRERIAGLAIEALAQAVRPTDEFGTPKGQPQTLAELIQKKVVAQLKTTSRDGYSRNRTVMDEVLEEEVRRTVRKELDAELKAAKEQVAAAVREQGAQLISETIQKLAGVRP